jgi:hypothetical protein
MARAFCHPSCTLADDNETFSVKYLRGATGEKPVLGWQRGSSSAARHARESAPSMLVRDLGFRRVVGI